MGSERYRRIFWGGIDRSILCRVCSSLCELRLYSVEDGEPLKVRSKRIIMIPLHWKRSCDPPTSSL